MPIHESIPSPDDLVQQARDWQADLFGANLEGSWMCAFNGDPGLGADWTGRTAAKVLNSLPDYITLNRGYPPNIYYSPYRYREGGNVRRDDLFIEAAAVVVDDVGDQADVDEAERRYRAAQQEYKDGPLAAWKAAGSVRADKPKAPKWVGVKIAREKLLERIGPPTKSLETSAGNCQWTYVLDEPCRDKAKLRALLLAIGSDARDLARVMRSPGGANWKAAALVDGKPFICRLHEEGCGTRYSIDDMLLAVGAEVHPEDERRRAPGGEEKLEVTALREAGLLLGSAATANPDTHGSLWLTCPGHLGDESEGGWPGAEVGHSAAQDQGRARVWPHGGFRCFHDSCRERNFDDLCAWVARNPDTKPILERLRDEAAAQFARLPVPDLGVLGGAGGGGGSGGGGGALGIAGGEDDEDDDPVDGPVPRMIRLDAGTLPRQVRDAVRALKKRARVYYYGRRSVEVILRAERNGIGGKVKAAQLVRLADNIVAQKLIEGVIDCYKYNAKAGDYIRADCTTRIAGNICNAKDLDLEEVIGTIRAPFLRRDGTIGGLQEGYDRATGLWVDWTDIQYRPVLDAECTRQGALEALARCKVPLSKYKFTGVGEAVALAGMLTPVARPAMIQVPIFGIDAPIQGSGKTKLALAICALMTGLAPALVQGIDDEKELDKRINAVLITGEQCIVVDNIVGRKWGTSDLCAAVTAERVDIRPLGTSEIVKVMNTFIVFVTGNNLAIEGDVVRRILICRIDPDIERPERASFDFDPVEYVRKHRVNLVHDLLVILRAYVLVSRPEQGGHTIGSFEDWSRVVRDSLLWLGEPDVAESIDLSRASSTSELEALLPLWAAAFGTGPATGRKAKDLRGYEHSVDLVQKAFGDCLRDNVFSLGADKITNEARWLGAWLGSKCDQRAAGFKLCKRKVHGNWLWYVSKGKEDDDDNPID